MPADRHDVEVRSNADLLLALTCARMGALDVRPGATLFLGRDKREKADGYETKHSDVFHHVIHEIEKFEHDTQADEDRRHEEHQRACDEKTREIDERFREKEREFEAEREKETDDLKQKFQEKEADAEAKFAKQREHMERGLVLKALQGLLRDMSEHFKGGLPVTDIEQKLQEMEQVEKDAIHALHPTAGTPGASVILATQKRVWQALGITKGFTSVEPHGAGAGVSSGIKRGASHVGATRPSWRT